MTHAQAMIHKMIVAALLIFAAASQAIYAQTATSVLTQEKLRTGSREDLVGVGLQVGTLSGLTFEYWYSRAATLNTSLTITRGNTATGLAHLWMIPNVLPGIFRPIVPFAGLGALAVWANSSKDATNINYNNDRFAVSLQLPLGLEYLAPGSRFSVFAEVLPSFEVYPVRVGFVNTDIGARLYF